MADSHPSHDAHHLGAPPMHYSTSRRPSGASLPAMPPTPATPSSYASWTSSPSDAMHHHHMPHLPSSSAAVQPWTSSAPPGHDVNDGLQSPPQMPQTPRPSLRTRCMPVIRCPRPFRIARLCRAPPASPRSPAYRSVPRPEGGLVVVSSAASSGVRKPSSALATAPVVYGAAYGAGNAHAPPAVDAGCSRNDGDAGAATSDDHDDDDDDDDALSDTEALLHPSGRRRAAFGGDSPTPGPGAAPSANPAATRAAKALHRRSRSWTSNHESLTAIDRNGTAGASSEQLLSDHWLQDHRLNALAGATPPPPSSLLSHATPSDLDLLSSMVGNTGAADASVASMSLLDRQQAPSPSRQRAGSHRSLAPSTAPSRGPAISSAGGVVPTFDAATAPPRKASLASAASVGALFPTPHAPQIRPRSPSSARYTSDTEPGALELAIAAEDEDNDEDGDANRYSVPTGSLMTDTDVEPLGFGPVPAAHDSPVHPWAHRVSDPRPSPVRGSGGASGSWTSLPATTSMDPPAVASASSMSLPDTVHAAAVAETPGSGRAGPPVAAPRRALRHAPSAAGSARTVAPSLPHVSPADVPRIIVHVEPNLELGALGAVLAGKYKPKWKVIQAFAQALFEGLGCSWTAIMRVQPLLRATGMSPQHLMVMALYIRRYLHARAAGTAPPPAAPPKSRVVHVQGEDPPLAMLRKGSATSSVSRTSSRTRRMLERFSLGGGSVRGSAPTSPAISTNARSPTIGSPAAASSSVAADESMGLWDAVVRDERIRAGGIWDDGDDQEDGPDPALDPATGVISVTRDELLARGQARLLCVAALLSCKIMSDNCFTAQAIAGIAPRESVRSTADLVGYEVHVVTGVQFDLAVRRDELAQLTRDFRDTLSEQMVHRRRPSSLMGPHGAAMSPRTEAALVDDGSIMSAFGVCDALLDLLVKTAAVAGEPGEDISNAAFIVQPPPPVPVAPVANGYPTSVPRSIAPADPVPVLHPLRSHPTESSLAIAPPSGTAAHHHVPTGPASGVPSTAAATTAATTGSTPRYPGKDASLLADMLRAQLSTTPAPADHMHHPHPQQHHTHAFSNSATAGNTPVVGSAPTLQVHTPPLAHAPSRPSTPSHAVRPAGTAASTSTQLVTPVTQPRGARTDLAIPSLTQVRAGSAASGSSLTGSNSTLDRPGSSSMSLLAAAAAAAAAATTVHRHDPAVLDSVAAAAAAATGPAHSALASILSLADAVEASPLMRAPVAVVPPNVGGRSAASSRVGSAGPASPATTGGGPVSARTQLQDLLLEHDAWMQAHREPAHEAVPNWPHCDRNVPAALILDDRVHQNPESTDPLRQPTTMAASSTTASVGTLLRNSKLAQFDRHLPQVYTSVNGHWGAVKARIPARMPATYLTFRALDTKFQVPDMRNADGKVQTVRRLKEQLPYVVPSSYAAFTAQDAPGAPPVTNLADLPRAELRSLIASLPTGHVKNPAEWHKPLRVDNTPLRNMRSTAAPGSPHAPAGPVYTVHDTTSAARDAAAALGSSVAAQAAATGDVPLVYGRMLAQYRSKHAVGVAGIVGEVEGHSRPSKMLTKFEVDEATWDRRARPILKLREIRSSLAPTGVRTSRLTAESRAQQRFGANGNRTPIAVQGIDGIRSLIQESVKHSKGRTAAAAAAASGGAVSGYTGPRPYVRYDSRARSNGEQQRPASAPQAPAESSDSS
ncbi:hypothetical protein GGF31_004567 [Allomyces arbusculus]|nr:hypothetical protein GGF31_004567 [Allomyces arbusculus]